MKASNKILALFGAATLIIIAVVAIIAGSAPL